MAEVHAVKEPETIQLVSHLLKIRHSQQMADVWDLGLNLALRISDLLSITFRDIDGDRLVLRESKTGKLATIHLNPKAQKIIQRIRDEHPHHLYLFQSYRNQQSRHRTPRPITRRAVGKAFELVGEELKIALGTHSMRKTRGYHLYQATNDIARVMQMLRHRSAGVTLRYIGVTQDEIDRDFRELVL
ncbi:tyrosine-type recombinase/integrase [Ferrimonas gelatinilytica]|uniref:Site-specific integrase n=1 Tax=Ferrimonas gelatinilytica TaxID=1255257 RepID=A0ABP9S8G6_9GAMM